MGFSWTVSSKFWNIGSSGVTDGGKFLLTYREKRGKEKRENGEEKKKNRKREGGKLKMEGGRGVTKWGEDFFFCFCFFFQNHWNLFWVYQNGNFLPGKKWLCSLWKIFLLRLWLGQLGGGYWHWKVVVYVWPWRLAFCTSSAIPKTPSWGKSQFSRSPVER